MLFKKLKIVCHGRLEITEPVPQMYNTQHFHIHFSRKNDSLLYMLLYPTVFPTMFKLRQICSFFQGKGGSELCHLSLTSG